MYGSMGEALKKNLAELRAAGLYKEERIIRSRQDALIKVEHPPGSPPREVLNFCANNYLGLSSHPDIIEAARSSLAEQGYAACFDANGGVFEPLLSEEDVILTDQLNHASIIDGIRLCKARRAIYEHSDMADLEEKLKAAADARYRLIATDGAFSMDGAIARLDEICDLADRYDALVMVDDCHATGFLGLRGRGSHEYRGVMGRVDIITGTFGKALGGASGGFVSSRSEIIEMLRQRSRPYLFSNTLAPAITSATLKVLEILSDSTKLRDKLEENTKRFRESMTGAGFEIKEGDHPIVPIMLYDARLAQTIAAELFDEGIYVIGFSFPVVPKGEARIRVQLSAGHDLDQVDQAVEAFTRVAKKHGVLS